MRRNLFILLMTINYLVGMPLLVVVWVVKKFNRKMGLKLAYKFNRFTGFLLFFSAGAKFETEGLEYMTMEEGALYVGNHRSMLDVAVMMRYLKKPVIFVGKKSVKKWPVLSWWMRIQDALFIDRTSPKEGIKAIKKGIAFLKNGESVVLFPEGTRSKNDVLLPFKKGCVRMAEKSGVPIIPCAIKGTDDVFENNGFNLKPNTIYFKVGEPIHLDQITLSEGETASDYVKSRIEEMYYELGKK
ncbi:MAG: lysophospholipid acyltransferase family protein [Vallitaleaceae bacterium]|jgi:1-acyl-sn-glycerol-3-phosphate acyltransferase|nr:lysophospholipid acyltransferase family protein [Vallitaleaceae bacterium]